ncbi:hypothetical protein Slin15195_G061180 [Septoria linicola]|uniref:Uncharacterized protein n=1 Tax=Septoria linicola TaxID=215465 RepID=A0A9Q9EK22_9PEZI|nr:hypothetical protein Slin14017_G076980 [Septoria linicola]USW52799.1 hypothetical protein Slin15195_G061180 [Septoria linicola]
MNIQPKHTGTMDVNEILNFCYAQYEIHFDSNGIPLAQIYETACKPAASKINETAWFGAEQDEEMTVSEHNLDVSDIDSPLRPELEQGKKKTSICQRALRLFYCSYQKKRRTPDRQTHTTLPTLLHDSTPRYIDWDLVIIEHALLKYSLRGFIAWLLRNFDICVRSSDIWLPIKRPTGVLRRGLALRSYATTLATHLSSGIWVVHGDDTRGIAETIVDGLERKLGA